MATFDFLNSSAWSSAEYVRNTLEEWYKGFPHNSEFYGNFISNNDSQHLSAFFELFIYSLFKRLDYELQYHYPVGSRKIDIYAEKNGICLLLDCTLSGEPNVQRSIVTIEKSILDVVESIPSPNFWVGVDFENGVHFTPSLSRVRKMLTKAIMELESSSINELKIPFVEKGWAINFTVFRKDPPVDRTLGFNISSQGGGFIDGESAQILRKTLNSKRGSSYQIEGMQYIIAINSSNIYINEEIISNTLYGSTNANLELIDTPFFYFKDAPQNTSVSAVLICNGLFWSNLGKADLQLWHNPWAKNPIQNYFLPVNQFIPVIDSNNKICQINRLVGKPTFEILSIEEDYLMRD